MIKLLIFDMDGTLYDINDVVSSNYEMQVDFLQQKTGKQRKDIVLFLEKNNIYPIIKTDSKSATELFSREGFDIQEWIYYREKNFDVSSIDISQSVNTDSMRQLASDFKLVLLSSNSYRNIKRILKHIDCDITLFSSIVCSDNFVNCVGFDKKIAMRDIAKMYSIPFFNILSIGDRYMTDIKPILELGGSGILLSSPRSISKIQQDLVMGKCKSCSDYEYYLTLPND